MEDEAAAELRRLRDSIDNMDAALVHLLAERFKITQQVGDLKARHGLPPADPQREAQQITRLRGLAAEAKLDPEFAEKFLTFVVAEVVRHHEAALRDSSTTGSDIDRSLMPGPAAGDQGRSRAPDQPCGR